MTPPAQVDAEFHAEMERVDRQLRAEQERATAWVESQVLPALDSAFD